MIKEFFTLQDIISSSTI
jgi:hypothetical protein